MLTHTANLLLAAAVAGVFVQSLAVVWVGGRVLRPRISRLRAPRAAAPTPRPQNGAAPAAVVRVRRRPRRDYRLALGAARG
ncbi:MAG: hypothetical protein J0I06_04890 [Planctomycetes bacterium]|nr:hypothetical protein [Planctomycetota bacterium]